MVKVWTMTWPKPDESGNPRLLNPDLLVSGQTPYQVDVGSTLVHTYSPDVSSHETFTFLLKRDRNRLVLFSFESPVNVQVAANWDRLCGESK